MGYIDRKVNEAHTEISGNFSLGKTQTATEWIHHRAREYHDHSEHTVRVGRAVGRGTAVNGRWYSDAGSEQTSVSFWERLQGKKANAEAVCGIHRMRHVIWPNNTNTTRGALSSMWLFFLIFITVQYERSYYLDCEGQESGAREMMKLLKDTQFPSWWWS